MQSPQLRVGLCITHEIAAGLSGSKAVCIKIDHAIPLTTLLTLDGSQSDTGCVNLDLAFGLSVGLCEARCTSRTLAACLVHAVDVDPHQAQLTGVELTKVRLKLRAKDHVDINLYAAVM